MLHAVARVLEDVGVAIAVLVCISLIVLLALLANYAKNKRSAYMRAVAKDMGMQFFTFGPKTWRWQSSSFQHHSLNILLNGREANLILGKTEIASIAVFDWEYSARNSDGFENQTVVQGTSPRCRLF